MDGWNITGPLTLGGGGPVGVAGEDCKGCRVHEGVTVASLGGLKSCSSPESSRSEGSEPTKSARLTVERAMESASICIGVSGFYKSSFVADHFFLKNTHIKPKARQM